MSSSAFLDVTRHVETALKADPPLAAGDIERSRQRRVAPASDAALRIYPQQATGQAAAVRGGFTRWGFDVSVECLVRAALEGDHAADAEAAADVLLQAVWQRLVETPTPAGIGSLVNDPRVEWTFIEGDRPLAVAIFTFRVGLSTHNRTLARWA